MSSITPISILLDEYDNLVDKLTILESDPTVVAYMTLVQEKSAMEEMAKNAAKDAHEGGMSRYINIQYQNRSYVTYDLERMKKYYPGLADQFVKETVDKTVIDELIKSGDIDPEIVVDAVGVKIVPVAVVKQLKATAEDVEFQEGKNISI